MTGELQYAEYLTTDGRHNVVKKIIVGANVDGDIIWEGDSHYPLLKRIKVGEVYSGIVSKGEDIYRGIVDSTGRSSLITIQ